MISYAVFCLNDTATTEIYTQGHTLSLHDALPISIALAQKQVVRLEVAMHHASAMEIGRAHV